jgi:hypothetical protein
LCSFTFQPTPFGVLGNPWRKYLCPLLFGLTPPVVSFIQNQQIININSLRDTILQEAEERNYHYLKVMPFTHIHIKTYTQIKIHTPHKSRYQFMFNSSLQQPFQKGENYIL